MNTAPTTYAIRVHGHLDDHWSTWLSEPDMIRENDGTTTLTASIADQAQLHGVLAALRDIGATITELRTISAPRCRSTFERPLHSERLTFRPATAEDAEATWKYRRLESVNAWLTGCPPERDSYRKLFTAPARLASTVIVTLGHAAAAPIIGDFTLRLEDTDPINPRGVFRDSVMIAPRSWLTARPPIPNARVPRAELLREGQGDAHRQMAQPNPRPARVIPYGTTEPKGRKTEEPVRARQTGRIPCADRWAATAALVVGMSARRLAGRDDLITLRAYRTAVCEVALALVERPAVRESARCAGPPRVPGGGIAHGAPDPALLPAPALSGAAAEVETEVAADAS